jgi:hypothetical protein
MDSQSSNDRFSESISYCTRIPFSYKVITQAKSDTERNAERYANSVLFHVLLAKHEKNKLFEDGGSDTEDRFDLLEAKLDLILYLLGKYMASQQEIPSSQDLELSATGIRFTIADEEIFDLKDTLQISLYLHAQFSQAVVLSAVIDSIYSHALGSIVTASFIDMDDQLRENMEKYVFREHRRSIAKIKNIEKG